MNIQRRIVHTDFTNKSVRPEAEIVKSADKAVASEAEGKDSTNETAVSEANITHSTNEPVASREKDIDPPEDSSESASQESQPEALAVVQLDNLEDVKKFILESSAIVKLRGNFHDFVF